ncbi:MAG: hypothetical protein J6L61_05365 [Ruminiclostridium sp.]|nr:hypothetical protein [Ruminiclostridium sp.]
MAGSKTYVYCNVLPSGYKSPYLYITDFEVKPGDIVIIPLRDREKAGLVIDVNTYSYDNAPFHRNKPNIYQDFSKMKKPQRFRRRRYGLTEKKQSARR